MNFITFVFSLLLIFSFGTFVALEKQSGTRKLRSTYLGHISANRKVLSKIESRIYKSFRGKTNESKETSPSNREHKPPKIPLVNPECARLNLWPLIQEGREEHPLLYDTALKLLDTFYPSLFAEKPKTKALFLNHFLKSAKLAIQKNQFSLEKLSLDPSFQMQYYKMLKGTKEWDLEKNIGYPSFLDVVKVEEPFSKVCLCHAHPGQLAVLFGIKAGPLLYKEIHQDPPVLMTKERIEKVCSKAHQFMIDPDLFSLIELGKASHPRSGKLTLIVKDESSQISLRKKVYNTSI